jgi:hypothetical protein
MGEVRGLRGSTGTPQSSDRPPAEVSSGRSRSRPSSDLAGRTGQADQETRLGTGSEARQQASRRACGGRAHACVMRLCRAPEGPAVRSGFGLGVAEQRAERQSHLRHLQALRTLHHPIPATDQHCVSFAKPNRRMSVAHHSRALLLDKPPLRPLRSLSLRSCSGLAAGSRPLVRPHDPLAARCAARHAVATAITPGPDSAFISYRIL